MRAHARRKHEEEDLRRRILRLNALPLRPATARAILARLSEESGDGGVLVGGDPKIRSLCELDPGWMMAQASARRFGTDESLALIASAAWWPSADLSPPAREFLGRIWRYSAAISLAAFWFARDAGDPDPRAVAAAGFLSQLGCWVLASIQPEWLVAWCRLPDPAARRQKEVAELGMELNELGRRSAERWGCPPLIVDAAWLNGHHAESLRQAAGEPERLAFIHEAARWAEKTPWALGLTRPSEPAAHDARPRILVAEIQVRCSANFCAEDATAREERLCRQNASLHLRLKRSESTAMASVHFAEAIAESDPNESLDEWAARAARTWCGEDGVSAARVAWAGSDQESADGARDDPPTLRSGANGNIARAPGSRPPTLIIPLRANGRTPAEIQVWTDVDATDRRLEVARPLIEAWDHWAALVADRALMEKRLQSAIGSCREIIESDEGRLRERKLDALGEFAGGAGHELNNPLAVIVGRAQLILARTTDAETKRSLRILLEQAARAHGMLRDLMFVARPPEPQPRSCRSTELLTACLREHQAECAERGIRLVDEIDPAIPEIWADPDALRHLADILLKNAIQATPSGAPITLRAVGLEGELRWSFIDSGKGISREEADHLFDPFFCGRQAGRGLGLGLARAARIVELTGGTLRWTSSPPNGTTFHVHLPIEKPVGDPRSGSSARPVSND